MVQAQQPKVHCCVGDATFLLFAANTCVESSFKHQFSAAEKRGGISSTLQQQTSGHFSYAMLLHCLNHCQGWSHYREGAGYETGGLGQRRIRYPPTSIPVPSPQAVLRASPAPTHPYTTAGKKQRQRVRRCIKSYSFIGS